MESLADALDEQSLFYQPANTCSRLLDIAQAEHIDVEETVHLSGIKNGLITLNSLIWNGILIKLPPSAIAKQKEICI